MNLYILNNSLKYIYYNIFVFIKLNLIYMNIGIIGNGFVGEAMAFAFSPSVEIKSL